MLYFPTPICFFFWPASASFCNERQWTGLLPLNSFSLPKVTAKTVALNPKPMLYCIDTSKHSHSIFSHSPHPLLTSRTCGSFSLKHIFFKTVVEIFSLRKFSGWPFYFFSLYDVVCSFLNVIWFGKDYSHSWRISHSGQIRFKAPNTGSCIEPGVRIIVRTPGVFIRVPPKADSETRIWLQGFRRWSQGMEWGSKTKKIRKVPKSKLMSRQPL